MENSLASPSLYHRRNAAANFSFFHCSVSTDAAEQMQNSCVLFAHVLWLTGTRLSDFFFSPSPAVETHACRKMCPLSHPSDLSHTLSLSLQPQSSLMDLMDVPEPGASADPWGTGAVSRAAAVSEDPWQSYGTDATLARASLRLGALTGDTDAYRYLCTCAPPWQHLDLESLLRRNAASLARLHFCSACLSGRVGVQEEEVMEDTQSLWDL